MTHMPQTFAAPTRDDAPLPGATFGQAVSRFYSRYATFSGRASRSEYWWVSLYFVSVLLIGGAVAGAFGAGATDEYGAPADPSPFAVMFGIFLAMFLLASFVPALALNARRLHDANITGWAQLVCLIPSLGGVIMMVLALLPSSESGARFDAGVPVRSPYGG